MTMEESSINDEILEMAVAREVDANRFYLALAAGAKSPAMKRIFKKLAVEELEHKAKLELEIMKTGKVVSTKKKPAGLTGKFPDYSQFNFIVDYSGVLLMGIQKEQASIKLYTELAEMMTDTHSREILLAIAEEEAGHKRRFQEAFNQAYESG